MRKALAVAVAAATGLAVAAAESMKVVTVVHARVQSDAPEWDDGAQTFVSTYGDSFAERYRGAFDSINTASVEGALMYVQAEGINVQDNTGCERKNEMQYVVFYALQVLQTEATIAAYDSDATNIPEYAPYVAMDSGSCTPEGTSLPAACLALFGGEEGASSGNSSITKEATVVLDVGPAVGAATKDSDARAPYPDTVWFSFPNSCVMETWAHKNSTCRSQYPGGLCAYGSRPDGDVCTFTYKTLGYLNLDDLVGITSLESSVTGAPYANYSEFCHDRDGEYAGVEFSADDDNDPDSVVSIPFWADPYDETACANRTTAMINMYNQRATEVEHMIALPTIETLRNANPPCYENSPRCAAAEFGCRRDLYAQICVVCESEEDGCVQASYTLSEVR